MLPFYPCPYLGQSICWQLLVWLPILNQLVAGSIMVMNMKLTLVLSFPSRVYCLMRSTHNTCQGVVMTSFDSSWQYFWLCLLFLARSARFNVWLDGIVHTCPVYHGFHCLFKTCVARILEVMVIPTDCHIHRDAGMINFHLNIWHYCVFNKLKMQKKMMFLHVFILDL